jgi:hypothetical protein
MPDAPNSTMPMVPGFMPTGMPMLAPRMPDTRALEMLITQLGTQTQLNLDGTARFNEPLAARIVAYRELALPGLQRFLNFTDRVPSLLEGLHVAKKLAETGVNGVEKLYPAVSRWNGHPDPLIQIHLAHFYRQINEPKTFGPMLATLLNRALNQYPLQGAPAYNVNEEVGETLLQQIARRTAQEIFQRGYPTPKTLDGPSALPWPPTGPGR